MSYKDVTEVDKKIYNRLVTHPLQSYEWGEFRKKTGIKVFRRMEIDGKTQSAFTLTIHPLPSLPYTIGYLPKGDLPHSSLLAELDNIGKKNKSIFIQLEPNKIAGSYLSLSHQKLKQAAHPLFTKYTFILDLTRSEDELLKYMHPKTRYNIKVAKKHGVEITEDNSDKAFATYLRLTEETTRRQKFYAHSLLYHKIQWETLPHIAKDYMLSSHLLLATYKKEVLVVWIVFVFGDTLYYPYGASSSQHREVMASNLMMWEAIRFGKKLGLKKFDMWGALGPHASSSDPWYGFHRFKQGYGADLVEYVGSYDYVINPLLYTCYKVTDKARWIYLRFKK